MKVTNSFSLFITYHKFHITFLHFCLTSGLHITLCFFIFFASFFLCLYCFCVHICLSLPSTFLLYHYALCFVVFPSLALRTKFSFLLCFIVSFCHLPSFVFLSPRLLLLPRFVSFVLFMPFFLPVFIRYCLSSLSNFTFSPLLLYCSPPTIQCFLLSSHFFLSLHNFSCNFIPRWFARHPNLHLAHATMWRLHTCYADLLAWIDDGKIDGVIFQRNKSLAQ